MWQISIQLNDAIKNNSGEVCFVFSGVRIIYTKAVNSLIRKKEEKTLWTHALFLIATRERTSIYPIANDIKWQMEIRLVQYSS